MFKKVFVTLTAVLVLLSLSACGSQKPPEQKETKAEQTEVVVFAAASMTETLTELKDMYEAVHPEISISYNFDSSGTLKTQITEGADCDLFISAGQKQMNQLDIAANPEVNTDGLDYVEPDSRIDLLENKIALVMSETSDKEISDFDELAEALKSGNILFVMGNSDVPVGQYTQKILQFYGLSEEELAANGVITYGSNVKEVTTQVKEGAVDCGIVYATDAFSAGLPVVSEASKEMCGQVIYPASVLKTSENPEEAQAFLDYLKTEEAAAVFKAVGFTPVK